LQQALEDEVSDFLGRARHAGAQETGPACNGYEPRTVTTTGGAIEVERSPAPNARALGMGR
jgi:transposase-like protein